MQLKKRMHTNSISQLNNSSGGNKNGVDEGKVVT